METTNQLDYWVDKGYDPVYHDLLYKGDVIAGYVAKPEQVTLRSVISKYSFLRRFTEAEKALIYKSDHEPVQLFLYELTLSSHVDLDLPEVRAAVQLISDLGIIATSRVEEILSKETK